jgi:hypothetical protein
MGTEDWCGLVVRTGACVAIEVSRPTRAEPRYRLVLPRAGTRYEADSYVAFEQIVAAG